MHVLNMSWSDCLDFGFGYNNPQHWVRNKEKQIKRCTAIYCCYSYATGASLGILGKIIEKVSWPVKESDGISLGFLQKEQGHLKPSLQHSQ